MTIRYTFNPVINNQINHPKTVITLPLDKSTHSAPWSSISPVSALVAGVDFPSTGVGEGEAAEEEASAVAARMGSLVVEETVGRAGGGVV
jgi:hypothetical protein